MGDVAQSNPIVLNSAGFPTTGQIWITEGTSIKIVFTDASDVVIKTEDNIPGLNDTIAASADEWLAGPTPTYIGATSFSLVGDQTSDFHVGRRVKTTNSGGTIYSTISATAYTTLTTVTVVNDSGTLDAGLSAVSYALLSAVNPAVPKLTQTNKRLIDLPGLADDNTFTNNNTFTDTNFFVAGSADSTKKVRLEVDGLTTAQTRVITPPDVDVTLPYKPGTYGGSQVYTASDTWTKPAGLKRVRVIVTAGGGGGGGCAQGGNATGGGGGAGATSIDTIETADLGATETVTVGAAGAASATGNNTGGTGGTSSFGTHCACAGGAGGSGSGTATAGAGGAVTTPGDIDIAGGPGFHGNGTSSGLNGVGGNGGSSYWGGGGLGAQNTGNGAAALCYGGGGAGAADNNTADRSGGAGKAGIVIVEEFF